MEEIEMSDINIQLGKALDFFIGIPSDQVSMSTERRETYGKLGSIRHTIYGMEYRSLGGFFLDDKYLGWQVDQVKKAIDFISDQNNYEKLKLVLEPSEDYYEFLDINLEKQIPVNQTYLQKI